MGTKKFSKELHDKYDKIGKKTVIKWICENSEFTAIENPDRFGIDLIIYKGDKEYAYAEVEVRPAWEGMVFKYDDLNVPYRKVKYFSPKKKCLFFAINKNLTAMFFCSGKKVLESPSAILDNKYEKNEKFFKVKLSDLRYKELK